MALNRNIRRSVAWTRLGLAAERAGRAFWPLGALAAAVLGAVLLGLPGQMPLLGLRVAGAVVAAGAVAALWHGVRRFRWPRRDDALARVDTRLTGRPLAALRDHPANAGQQDALWQAHQARMARQAQGARAVAPDLRLAPYDRNGLRLMALLVLAVGVLFGTARGVGSGAPVPGRADSAAASWEGWIEPPRYTRRPVLYLNDLDDDRLSVPEGSTLTLRLYGEEPPQVTQTLGTATPVERGVQRITVAHDGELRIAGRVWALEVEPDAPPEVEITASAQLQRGGGFALPFRAFDDFAVRVGQAQVTLDLAAVDRRHGLAVAPQPRAALILDLPMPYTGDRGDFTAQLSDDLSEHPWANLPVTVSMTVSDDLGQSGQSDPVAMVLPGKRFFEPMAAAVAEQRRDLLWSQQNAARVAQVLRALSWQPEGVFRRPEHLTRMTDLIGRIEAQDAGGFADPVKFEQLNEDLWAFALELEEGAIEGARERLRRARERLAEAMRNGASDAEIAELMDELRAATDAYMDLLAQEAEPAENTTDQPDGQDQSRSVQMDEIQRLMDEIQRLMEEGRMAEAQMLMEQLNQLLDNLRMTEGGDGSPGDRGRRSMEQLGDTLRDQQDLSDEAFRELQDRFNDRAQQGQQQPGQQGQGATGGQQGQAPGQQGDPGQDAGPGEGPGPGDLASRQRALRDALEQQRRALPGVPGEAADAAREALDRAGRAMDRAEDALREDDLPGAINNQAQALEELREGMARLGEALDKQQRAENGQGQDPGEAKGGDRSGSDQRDPLGRRSGNGGGSGTQSDDSGLNGQSAQERARELLEDLRRRSSELDRPEGERDYIGRLLERF